MKPGPQPNAACDTSATPPTVSLEEGASGAADADETRAAPDAIAAAAIRALKLFIGVLSEAELKTAGTAVLRTP
ncbi:hypothetical protein MGN01_43640 [Methylobacterium gnaphalii]|uniref:Uncharacterized protein n=1 Tax=Methylobacterium gnaphalii TaxID=1010610 RepID=A0A512JRE4_9HYPH|nr:hypothetical protein MGN01_43640 [Methylobacterium gnaphalii]GLS51480.1 hypothetical protein GCM10007885_43370 [Methylobacterium gnaphalii]